MRYNVWLSTAQAKQEAKRLAQNGGGISITGGEPTIRPDLFEIISYCKSLGAYTDLQTNAMMCSSEAYAKRLAEAGLDSAFVSLHSHKGDLSDKITQTSGAFEKTIQGIKNLASAGIKININTVVNSLNYAQLPKFVDFVAKNFPKATINFSVAQPVGNAWEKPSIVPKYSKIKPFLLEAAAKCEKRGIWFSNPFCGVPPCFFSGFEKNCLELEVFKENCADQKVETTKCAVSEKVKGPKCKECDFDFACFGVWKNYAKLYGTKELVPVKGFDFSKLENKQ